MKTNLKLLLPMLLIGFAMASFMEKPVALPPVKTTYGLVSGTTNRAGDIRIFRGIPFAAPPVGELRWKAPQPVESWSGVRACTTFGASPMQAKPAAFSMWSDEFLIPKEPISEDCLYLNVWTGAKAAGPKKAPLRPVLVWIYGGGFNSGGSGVPIYDGEAFAKKGIVFVSFNYRVGPFGFFAHPELTRESGQKASGNYGLMDQVAALQWVKTNIAAFGGDPNQVTIAGQSAGSMSVNCMVVTPLAKGLFTKAIAESGANFSNSYQRLQQAEEGGLKLMQTVGAATLAELRAKPAGEILNNAKGFRGGPIIDGYVLTESIAGIFAARQQNDVTLLTGWNQDEGLSSGQPKNAVDFRKQIEQQYGTSAPAFLTHYPATTDAEAAASQLKLSRDMIFGAQNYTWANTQASQGKPVYVYRFTRNVPATGAYARYGAFHTGEVAYAYDNLKFIDHTLRPLTATDTELAQTMSAFWVNFIRTGDPNGKGLPHWPRYMAKDRQVMILGDKTQAQPIPDRAALDFLVATMNQKPN